MLGLLIGWESRERPNHTAPQQGGSMGSSWPPQPPARLSEVLSESDITVTPTASLTLYKRGGIFGDIIEIPISMPPLLSYGTYNINILNSSSIF